MSTESGDALPRGLLALRERNYRLYFIGHLTSQVGTWIELTAVSWILYELTNSAVLLGLGGLCRAAPTILLALPGGAIADRLPRRPLLLATETTMLVASAVIGALALTGQLQFWHLYLLSITTGTLNAFSTPARQALFPALVPRPAMPSAVMWNSLAARGSGLIGPSVAGAALVFGGYAAPFLLNAVSFLAMLGALAAMRLPALAPVRESPQQRLGKEMLDGVRFIRRSPLIISILGLEIVAGLFGHNSALITIIARDVLGTGPQGLGSLMSALSAGALCGMLFMVLFHIEQRGRVILIAGAVYSLFLIGFGFSGWLGLSLAILFALGAVDGMWGVARNTVVQLAVPDEIRGRAMSVVFLVTRGSTPLGHLYSGVLASLIGGPGTVLLGGLLIGTGVVTAGLRVPALASYGRPEKNHPGVPKAD